MTFKSYARNIAAMALHFGKIPTELDVEQVQEYFFLLQKRSKTPSQTYFKHTVYGLRFLLKSEGLPYEFLHLPSIKHEKKLPTVLSKEEIAQRPILGTTITLNRLKKRGYLSLTELYIQLNPSLCEPPST